MTRKNATLAVGAFPALLTLLGFMLDSPSEIGRGLGMILTSPSILLHDYLAIGGLGATLINAGLLGLICTVLVWFLDIDMSGPFIAAIYTVIGFAFFRRTS